MMKKATALLTIVGALILWWAGSARADQPETFEPGTGKYILVLADPRTEVDDPVTGKKKAREPDVQKHGGKVLHKKDGTRVIKLPTRAAGALRKEENVAYLQRIWLGESREEWGEEAPASSLKTSDAAPETLDADLTWSTGTYLYDGSGNIKQIGTDTYRYDTLGRLTQAVVKGITETYQYDSFGNLVGKTVNGQPRPIPVDASSNRLQGEAYDAAGNVTTQSGQPRYHYDSFSMVDRWERPPSNRKRYIYGPADERIGVVLQEGQFSRWKIRDFSGKVLREFKADDTQGIWEWIEDYAYADGRLLAAERESYYGGKRHFHTDHLGSVRMITDQSRKRIAVHDFSAFGVEQTDSAQEYNRYAGAGGGGDFRAEPMKFTGHERDQHGWLNVDNDDSLDYMHARYYDPNLGRFLSVDPYLDLKKATRNPQNWNRYVYVMNSPVNRVDPDGRDDGMVGLSIIQDCQLNGCRPNIQQDTQDARSLASISVSFIPGVGEGYDTLTAVSGRDYIAGSNVPTWARVMGAVLPFLGAGILNKMADAAGPTLVIGKLDDLRVPGAIREGETTINLASRGSPKANWTQNAGELRAAMRRGAPIRDATVDPVTGKLIRNTGTLRAERGLLRSKGWRYDEKTRFWYQRP